MDRRFKGWSTRCGARGCALLLACAGLALTLGVAALFAGSAPSFARAKSYPTGTYPVSVAIGDLNGDGKPDLAARAAVTVSVLLGRGDGSFEARRNYPTGTGPGSVAIGDLNGDGKPDLATANSNDSTVSVLLNRGDGSFEVNRDYAAGYRPESVAIGDLNDDGKADLAAAIYDGGTVSVLLNRGDGTFQPRRNYVVAGSPGSVVIGDLNGDGKADLATRSGREKDIVSVLLNRGQGTFRAKRDYRTGRGPNSLAIGDLNGDGKPDLATANSNDSTVSVLLNRGDGSFETKVDYRTGRYAGSVVIGDLNDDGKPDLATFGFTYYAHGFAPGTVSVLVNKGDGRFQAKIDYRAGGNPESVALGDLNGDGKSDLVTNNRRGISVLLNTPGLCTVQDVKRQRLPAAERTIARANCRVGKVRRAYSRTIRTGRVISQKPSFGTVLPGDSKVNLVVSRGRKR